MPFQVSPGVNVSEIDLTTVVPAVSSTEGAIAGVFRWGPIDKLVLVSSEDNLVKRFGKPTNLNPETFFTAASFLSYGNKLYISRAATIDDETGVTGVLTAMANSGSISSNLVHLVLNEDDYETKVNSFESDVHYVAKYPGALGNSLKISICESATAYNSTINLKANTDANAETTKVTFTVGSASAVVNIANAAGSSEATSNTIAAAIANQLSVGDIIETGNSTFGKQLLKIRSVGTPSFVLVDSVPNGDAAFTITFEESFNLSGTFESSTVNRYWEFFNNVDSAPGQSPYVASFGNTAASDEIHAVVVDEDGKVSGIPGTVLEVYQNVSRATDAKTEQGASNYYKEVINQNSTWVWVGAATTTGSTATAALIANSTATKPLSLSFVNGSDGADENNVTIGRLSAAYNKFVNPAEVDISLLLTGKSRGGTNGEQVANYLIDNIAEVRKDCVVFVSPDRADVVTNAGKDEAADIATFRNSLRSSSYAVLDSGYKYMYDKYNDVYRYIPLNGDTAGLCVRTDSVRDPWFSPAGFNRGQIKNVVKLAYNPDKADRDVLYKAGINPVVTFPGQGTVLYGDKTLLSKPSAFDRINVRRLFIVLEKAIATASQFTLFEFNDEFTRAQFKNLVEPFLRDVQGRRGIYDFKVVCDETNNTGEVIDRNEFVGDIYVKPAKSINYIQLNFVAVRTGVEFSEIVGQF
jgi:hypothetical protein